MMQTDEIAEHKRLVIAMSRISPTVWLNKMSFKFCEIPSVSNMHKINLKPADPGLRYQTVCCKIFFRMRIIGLFLI